MNSRTLTCIAMALLAVLATPVRLAAQDNGDHNQQKHVRYAIKVLDTPAVLWARSISPLNNPDPENTRTR